MTSKLQATWETYTATWKMTNRADRLAAWPAVLDEHAVYTDPLVTTASWDDLLAYMENFHEQFPGGYFLTTKFLAHHHKSVACWEMKNRDDVTIGSGISYAEYNSNGKLVSMNGFFEPGA